MAAPQAWLVTLRGPHGRRYQPRTIVEDIDRPHRFRVHLLEIARSEAPNETDGGENWLHRFELEVREPGQAQWQDPRLVLRFQKDA